MKYINRSLASIVQKASRSFKCVLLSGPRQVGKTTLLRAVAEPTRLEVTLDDPAARALARRDPELFLTTYPPPVLIDEVQYAPELFPFIKMRVDKTEECGLYWLTGSQPFHLMKNVSESLAGRVAILNLQGLSEAEREGRDNRPFIPEFKEAENTCDSRLKMAEKIFRGSFPQLAAVPETDVGLYMSSYVATYLSRDIRDLVKASHEHEFMTFLSCLAARSGQLLNANNIAQDVGVSAPTIRSWISILESSGVICLLRPYHNNLTKRAIATPKIFFTDTGLAAYLCGYRSAEELERAQIFGHLFENWVIMEVLKSWWYSGKNCEAWFYRDKEGHEIDLLIKDAMRLYPIEIKVSASPDVGEIESNIKSLSSTGTKLEPGAVLCLAKNSIPLGKELFRIGIGII